MDEYESLNKVLKDALNTTDVSYNHLCIEIALELLEIIKKKNSISQVENLAQKSVQFQQDQTVIQS